MTNDVWGEADDAIFAAFSEAVEINGQLVRAIVGGEYVDHDGSGVVQTVPVLAMRERDVDGISRGDLVIARGRSYVVDAVVPKADPFDRVVSVRLRELL